MELANGAATDAAAEAQVEAELTVLVSGGDVGSLIRWCEEWELDLKHSLASTALSLGVYKVLPDSHRPCVSIALVGTMLIWRTSRARPCSHAAIRDKQSLRSLSARYRALRGVFKGFLFMLVSIAAGAPARVPPRGSARPRAFPLAADTALSTR
eukprot:476812-Pleurochrysis_carterae.AAC.2